MKMTGKLEYNYVWSRLCSFRKEQEIKKQENGTGERAKGREEEEKKHHKRKIDKDKNFTSL